MNSVSSPASAANSALPVPSIAALQRITPRSPSGVSTTTPVTAPFSTTTPFTMVPYQISAPALRFWLRYHSDLLCEKTTPVSFTPWSISLVKPTRLPQ